MSDTNGSFRKILRRESLTLVLLIFVGAVILPIAIFLVGAQVFGDYAGDGMAGFFRKLHGGVRNGRPVVIFLLLSPYLIWQLLRLTFYVFRRLSAP